MATTTAATTDRVWRWWRRHPSWWCGPTADAGRHCEETIAGGRDNCLMATHRFRIVNVFPQDQGPFPGNPLFVVEGGGGWSEEPMPVHARQFSLSETPFILPPTEKARANARVRIFTPS